MLKRNTSKKRIIATVCTYYISTYTWLHTLCANLRFIGNRHQLFESSTTNHFYSTDLQMLLTELHCFSHLKWMWSLPVMVSATNTVPLLNKNQIRKPFQILQNKSVLLSEVKYSGVPKLAASENPKLRVRRTFPCLTITLIFVCTKSKNRFFACTKGKHWFSLSSVMICAVASSVS